VYSEHRHLRVCAEDGRIGRMHEIAEFLCCAGYVSIRQHTSAYVSIRQHMFLCCGGCGIVGVFPFGDILTKAEGANDF